MIFLFLDTIYIMEKQIISDIIYDLIHQIKLPNHVSDALVSDEVLEAMVIEVKNPSMLNESVDTNELSNQFYEDYMDGNLDEGIIKKIFGGAVGGITGLLLGKSIGEAICKILGIGNGPLYNLITSKIVATALGVAIGKQLGE